MKKIGIMSMQRIVNYGSFLQAYGLRKTIEAFGENVEFVDYEYEKSVIEPPKKKILKRIFNNINIIEHRKKANHIKKFREEYQKYLSEYLNVNTNRNTYPNIDTLVVGSDEVFNCLQNYPVGYSRNLFGYGFEKTKKISYAASFGHTTIEGLRKYKIDNEVGNLLSQFNALSVRDENSQYIVQELTNKKAIISCDPVLISDYSSEIKGQEIQYSNYIIIYAYAGRLNRKEEKAIKQFAKTHNKKIISLGFYQKIADENLIVDPFQVLSYIKNADYVITDTFHGTVFSIKMNTKFCTIIRKSNYNKLYYLLKKFDLESQLINSIEDIEKIYNKEIDFRSANKTINLETEKTKKYLKENI